MFLELLLLLLLLLLELFLRVLWVGRDLRLMLSGRAWKTVRRNSVVRLERLQ
jgi:hypothetical protein